MGLRVGRSGDEDNQRDGQALLLARTLRTTRAVDIAWCRCHNQVD